MTHTDAPVFPQIHPLGIEGVLVRFATVLSEPANRAALAFRAAVEAAGLDGVLETSIALASVYVRFDPLVRIFDDVAADVATVLSTQDWYAAPLPARRKLWHIPACFEGEHAPQLAEAAALAGLDARAAVASLTDTPVRVQSIGFAPGQPYLGQLPPAWSIPRQTGLTAQVPAGSIVVAIRQFCLFANAAPTGWRHIGQTRFRVFHPEAADPFVLTTGDEIRFHPVSATDLASVDPAGGGAKWELLP
jgi:inhibitor of KinA